MSDSPTLPDKMDAPAEAHPRAAELREKAQALREGIAGFYADPQTIDVKTFLGRWARARRLWCEISGKNLI